MAPCLASLLGSSQGDDFRQWQRNSPPRHSGRTARSKSYFAYPYPSWESEFNETPNGLICQYFPKGSNFFNLTPSEVKRAEA